MSEVRSKITEIVKNIELFEKIDQNGHKNLKYKNVELIDVGLSYMLFVGGLEIHLSLAERIYLDKGFHLCPKSSEINDELLNSISFKVGEGDGV